MDRYQKGPKMAQTKGKKMMKNVCFFCVSERLVENTASRIKNEKRMLIKCRN